MWLLGFMGGSAVLITAAFAADLPTMLGGKEAYTPSFYTPTTFLVSTIIGLCAGLITGAIGAGGGFIQERDRFFQVVTLERFPLVNIFRIHSINHGQAMKFLGNQTGLHQVTRGVHKKHRRDIVGCGGIVR